MTAIRLFTAFPVRRLAFPNRIIVSPMCQYAAVEGDVQDWHIAHHARFALSGVGGAIVEATGVTPEGRITPGCLGLWHERQIAGMAAIVKLYHDRHIPVGIQLAHAGRKGSAARPWDGAQSLAVSSPDQAWQTVAPSAVAHAANWPAPHALSMVQIAELIAAFAEAARRAVAAGFDFVEIHGAHGYLVHSFLSPLSNRRSDDYGGSFENRSRLLLEVANAVRAVIPPDMPLFWRLSAVDHDPAGLQIDDTIRIASALRHAGVDVIDVSSGGIHGPIAQANVKQRPGYQVSYAGRIRREANIATMAVGLIIDPAQAEAILADGEADLLALGRELLADPAFAYRAARALGLPSPESVLPDAFAFYLSRRDKVLSDMESA